VSRRAALAAAGGVAALALAAFGWTARSSDADPPALDGAALFRSKGCASCHSGPDTSSQLGAEFPNLGDAAAWAGERRPGMDARAYLAESIGEPWAFTAPGFTGRLGPVEAMPALGHTEAEIDALVTYLLAG
jgi:cytochrome c551/c552